MSFAKDRGVLQVRCLPIGHGFVCEGTILKSMQQAFAISLVAPTNGMQQLRQCFGMINVGLSHGLCHSLQP